MTEWLKVHAWKACVRPKTVPRVRIPLSPPKNYSQVASSRFILTGVAAERVFNWLR